MLNLFIVLKGAISPKFSVPFKGFAESSSKLSFVKAFIGAGYKIPSLPACFRFFNFNPIGEKFKSYNRTENNLPTSAKSVVQPMPTRYCNDAGQPMRKTVGQAPPDISKKCAAFSLVEMLMALLVASLLMAAIAPVMTRKINENLNINGDFNPKSNTIKKEIIVGSDECPNDSEHTHTAEDGSEYCEGTYTVPADYTGVIRVTVIGAGGGGGTAPTAGFSEYTTAGSSTFTVPAMVNEIEATLVSGGAGGAGGGIKQKTETFVIDGTPDGDNGDITRTSTGEGVWQPSSALNNAWVKISACGGGGGGVIGSYYGPLDNYVNPGHGAYFANKMLQLPSNASSGLDYRIGGKGGYSTFYPDWSNSFTNGASNGGSSATYMQPGCINKAKGGNGNDVSGDGSNACCNDSNDSSEVCYANGGTAPAGAGHGGRGGKSVLKHSWGSRSAGGGAGSLQGFGGNGGEGSHSALAGGGGGGSTWLGGTMANMNSMVFQVGGGGGGCGPASNFAAENSGLFPAGGGGGGGAGMAGYEGGNGGGAALIGATPETIPATSGGGATSSPIFGIGYCLGGTSGRSVDIVSPSAAEAKNGAMRITYIDYGPGASGGGAGNIVPTQRYNNVASLPDQKINIQVGAGGKGGTAGTKMDSSGNVTWPTIGFPCNTGDEPLVKTELTDRNGNVLLTTYASHYTGGLGGHPTGVVTERVSGGGSTWDWQRDQAAAHGNFMRGIPLPNPPYQTFIDEKSDEVSGFEIENGYAAGDKKEQTIGKTYKDGTVGGRGGTLKTPWYTCDYGAGGTLNSKDGKDGGAGGCGGGGGYSFGKGGNGGSGYARISWNKYWDIATGAYRLANTGSGGGGASGNIMTYSIKVMGNQAIRIRIGKGGKGAEIVNNNVTPAKKGGDTVFGDDAIGEIRAGGGEGGSSPSVVNNNGVNTLVNGVGGNISSICHFGGKSYLNNKSYCTKGLKGFNAEPAADASDVLKGANGASLTNCGTGGEGGIAGTSNYSGSDATGIGSGGGGASIYDLGDNSINSTSGTNKGGSGSNGKIIIELYQG